MSNSQRPKISVCIPTYNAGRFLPDAIESILKQTYTDYELIILDNCSTDNTKEIVSRYSNSGRKIKFKSNAENVGMVNNWNLCLAEAEGEYIKYVFADDTLFSDDALQSMASVLDADASVTLVGSARYFIDDKSAILRSMSAFGRNTVTNGVAVINRCLYEQKNLIGEPTAVMFRKKDAHRGFNPAYKQLVDLEMWFFLLERGKFAYIPEPLSCFRLHATQQTAINKKGLDPARDNFFLFDEYIRRSYVRIGSLQRAYIRYNNLYEIWKLYKSHCISREMAVTEIRKHWSYGLFLIAYPLYKLYKPLMKSYVKLKNRI